MRPSEMDNQAVILAVSLYGSSPNQQPDPIVLRHEDESWHHFNTLMLSLYKNPPSTVHIKYLDDENDWIDMGSEAEFSEALRMTRSSGEILQIRVLPVSDDGWEDHTYVRDSPQTSLATSKVQYTWIPTTDARYECEERLVYPHTPAAPAAQGVMITSVGGTQYIDAPATQPWLVYPHPNTEPQSQSQFSQDQCSEPREAQKRETNSSSAPNPDSHNSSDSHSEETTVLACSSRPAVASRNSTQATGDRATLMAAATAWQNAAKLPPQEKVKFLKRLVSSGHDADFATAESESGEKPQGTKPATNNAGLRCEQYASVDSLLKEFAAEPSAATQPRKSIWEGQNVQLTPQGQDPFEVDSVNVMDQAQLLSAMDNSPTLTPTRLSTTVKDDSAGSSRQMKTEASSAFKFAGMSPLPFVQASSTPQKPSLSKSTTVTVAYEASQPSSVLKVENASPALLANPKRSSKEEKKTKTLKEMAATADSKSASKTTVKPPVPLPRAMLMLEGAPCGANAVAIEMPAEAESSKAELEGEEVAASGGAASVAASEETGEILARDGDAAAVSSQIKVAEERECGAGAVVSWDTSPILQVEVQSHKHRKDKSPEKKSSREKEEKSEKHSLRKKSESSDKKSREDRDRKRDEKKRKEEKEDKKRKDEKDDKKKEEKEDKKKKEEKDDKKRKEDKEDKKKNEDKEDRKKKEEREKKKHTKDENRLKLSEDVESGEKVRVKGDAALQYNDFVRHMRKLKKEIQASIVRDVTQETYRIVQTGLFTLSQSELNADHKETFSEGVEHIGIYCDHCNSSIMGIRYKCGNCLDFDLCERCEGLPDLHDPTHVFLKLRQPARNAGCGSTGGAGEKYCLLRENIYQVEGAEAACDPGTPVDLSIQSTGEEQPMCKIETAEEEKPVVPEAAPQQIQPSKEQASNLREHHVQEYEDLLQRLCRMHEIQDSSSRDRQQYGHLGGCSETLNYSSFDLTMARGIDSGMNKIGQAAEERLVAHTGLLPSAPPRQRYRSQDKPECNSSECGCSSSGGSSIVQLPTPPDSSLATTLPLSLDSCGMVELVQLDIERLEDQLKLDGAARAASSISEAIPLNLTKSPAASTASPIPESTPMVALTAASAPKSTPMVALIAPSLPESVPMTPLMAQSVPESTPMVPLTAMRLPESTPLIPLRAASLPKSAPVAPPAVTSLPESTAMIPLTPATPLNPTVAHSVPVIPLEAAAPASPALVEPVSSVGSNEGEVEADEEDYDLARGRRDSEDSDDFVLENVSSSDDDDDDDADDNDNGKRGSRLEMVWDSDSSDDFCIIDPENAALVPEGFELLPDSTSLTAALTQSQTVTCDSDIPSRNSCPAPSYEEVMSASQRLCCQTRPEVVAVATVLVNEEETQQAMAGEEKVTTDVEEVVPLSTINVAEATAVKSVEVARERESIAAVAPVETIPAAEQEATASAPDTAATASMAEDVSFVDAEEETKVVGMSSDVGSGLIHQMSEEEKNRLLELLRMEMGREFILEARRAEAEFRNRELELIGAHTERSCEAVAREEEAFHSSSTASVAGSVSSRSRSLSRSTSVASSIGAAVAGQAREGEQRISRSSSVASPSSTSTSTRDADCQTVGVAAGHDQPSASHIIHNVATGMSKAATTAFLTAKDVFHALQAKQSEWKAPSSSYKPPQSQWKPPADTYRPPVNTYKPPENTYKPPEDTYKPPEDTYKPPEDTYKPPESTYRPPENTYRPPRDYDDYSDFAPPNSSWGQPRSVFVPPNIEWVVEGNTAQMKPTPRSQHGQISGAPAGNVSMSARDEEPVLDATRNDQGVVRETPSLPSAPDGESSSVDDSLESERRQRLGMHRLVEMGFANRVENRRLLAQFDGDLEKVIQALVEGQATDQWAQTRH